MTLISEYPSIPRRPEACHHGKTGKWNPVNFSVGLPLAGIPRRLCYILTGTLDTGANVGHAIAERLPDISGDRIDGLTDASARTAHDTAHGVRDSGQGVAENYGKAC